MVKSFNEHKAQHLVFSRTMVGKVFSEAKQLGNYAMQFFYHCKMMSKDDKPCEMKHNISSKN